MQAQSVDANQTYEVTIAVCWFYLSYKWTSKTCYLAFVRPITSKPQQKPPRPPRNMQCRRISLENPRVTHSWLAVSCVWKVKLLCVRPSLLGWPFPLWLPPRSAHWALHKPAYPLPPPPPVNTPRAKECRTAATNNDTILAEIIRFY